MTSSSSQGLVVDEATTASPIAQPHQATGWRSRGSQVMTAEAHGCCLRRARATPPAAPSRTTTSDRGDPGREATVVVAPPTAGRPGPRRRRPPRSAGRYGWFARSGRSWSRSPSESAKASSTAWASWSCSARRRLGRGLAWSARRGRRASGWPSRAGSATASSSGWAWASAWASACGVGSACGPDVAGGAVPDHRDVAAGRDRERAGAERGVAPLPRLRRRTTTAPSRRRRAGCSRTGRRRARRRSGRRTPGNRWT